MTVKEQVRDLIDERAPGALCDDCIGEILGHSRQHANHKTSELAQEPDYVKAVGPPCAACGSTTKLVTRTTRHTDDESQGLQPVPFDPESDQQRAALLLAKGSIWRRGHDAAQGEHPLAEREDVLMELEFHNNRRLYMVVLSRVQLRDLVRQAQQILESS